MGSNSISLEQYLATGWQPLLGRWPAERTIATLVNYNNLIGARPRVYSLQGRPGHLLNACTDGLRGLDTGSQQIGPPESALPLIRLLRERYSPATANFLGSQLGATWDPIGDDRVAIAWHLYCGNAAPPLQDIITAMAAVCERHAITVLHCPCLSNRHVNGLEQVDCRVKVSCSGVAEMTKLFHTLHDTPGRVAE